MYWELHFLLHILSDLYSWDLIFNSDESAIAFDENNIKTKVVTFLEGDKYNANVIRGPRNSTTTALLTMSPGNENITPVIIVDTKNKPEIYIREVSFIYSFMGLYNNLA
jgi:hypothetical protein